MTHFLVFQLYGQMASWGDIAVGEVRPTLHFPTKSALLGLLAAAVGIDRQDQTKLDHLRDQLTYGVEVKTRGRYLYDYHTIQTPLAKNIKTKRPLTRREELNSGNLSTLLTSRYYWTAPYYRIAFYGEQELLKSLKEALDYPIYIPYLGRKACPIGLPLNSKVVNEATFENAINTIEQNELTKKLYEDTDTSEWFWEKDCPTQLSISEEVHCRSNPMSRKQWLFSEMTLCVHRQKGKDDVH